MQTNIRTPQAIFVDNVQYEVPAFQRRYIWSQEQQWEPLWEDVSDLAENIIETGDSKPHFMGAVVLQQLPTPTGEVGKRIVVDGQQRLTTLQLMLDAVQEVCQQRGHRRAAARLKSLVEIPEEHRGNNPDDAFKVWPTIADRRAFRQAMRDDLSSDEFKNSRIVAAHNYFKNQTELWLQGFSEEDDKVYEAAEALDSAVRNRLELVVIDLGQSDDPHIIFETLNARGTPLLPSDMIKNQILYKAGFEADEDDEQLPEIAAQLWGFSDDWWGQEIGRGYQRRPRIDIYLNNWLTLRNQSETKVDNEFAVFNIIAEHREKAGVSIHSIAGDIGRLGNIYRDIDQLKLPDIEPFLYRRQVMGIGVITPVLLWLLSSDVPSSQFSRSITALESYLVRRMTCGMSARTYGQIFVRLLEELERSGPETAGDTVVRYLAQQTVTSSFWPNDQLLLETFANSPLYWSLTRGRLNLILQGIEGELRARSMAETQDVPRNLHIEHIMPQTWHRHWPLPGGTADEERASASRNRMIQSIGNLTLVTQRLNSALSNAPWEQKRETLAQHSTLFLNKILLDNAPAVWDEAAIAGRAERLHQAAVRVWPHANAIP